MLRYLSYQVACDVTFVWWVLSWFVTRHVLFCKVIASAYWDVPTQLDGSRPERGYNLTKEVHEVFVSLLIILEVSALFHPHFTLQFNCPCQIIQSIWSYLICGVAYRVLKGEGADDSRSDSER